MKFPKKINNIKLGKFFSMSMSLLLICFLQLYNKNSIVEQEMQL
jgi:hypothetical protein